MLNVSPTKTSEQEREIDDAHSKVFDEGKKVKFSSLRYDLGELFDNVPSFDAPTLLFNQIDGIVPEKLSYPVQKRNDMLAEPLGTKKPTKMEEARLVNSAILN